VVHRICGQIERRLAGGQALEKAASELARYWANRYYRCDSRRRVHLSRATILRLYYRWRDYGRVRAALALHHRRGGRKIHSEDILEVARLCAASGVTTFSGAFAKLPKARATKWGYWHALPAEMRCWVKSLFAARIRLRHLELVSSREIDKFARRLPK
jgi:hypothetical protein